MPIASMYDPRIKARVEYNSSAGKMGMIESSGGCFTLVVYPFNNEGEAADYLNKILARAHIMPEQQRKSAAEELAQAK